MDDPGAAAGATFMVDGRLKRLTVARIARPNSETLQQTDDDGDGDNTDTFAIRSLQKRSAMSKRGSSLWVEMAPHPTRNLYEESSNVVAYSDNPLHSLSSSRDDSFIHQQKEGLWVDNPMLKDHDDWRTLTHHRDSIDEPSANPKLEKARRICGYITIVTMIFIGIGTALFYYLYSFRPSHTVAPSTSPASKPNPTTSRVTAFTAKQHISGVTALQWQRNNELNNDVLATTVAYSTGGGVCRENITVTSIEDSFSSSSSAAEYLPTTPTQEISRRSSSSASTITAEYLVLLPTASNCSALILQLEQSVSNGNFTSMLHAYAKTKNSTLLESESVTSDSVEVSKPFAIEATTSPSRSPTVQTSVQPSTFVPSVKSTSIPTMSPTSIPSPIPTVVPTIAPTSTPTTLPTSSAISVAPTFSTPTWSPSATTTTILTLEPSASLSIVPTTAPTPVPTAVPSTIPTTIPSSLPTVIPTAAPTAADTQADLPTWPPSLTPSLKPSGPSTAPSFKPSKTPTVSPSCKPSKTPTRLPSAKPTSLPTFEASPFNASYPNLLTCSDGKTGSSSSASAITSAPSRGPTRQPSRAPSNPPSWRPSSSNEFVQLDWQQISYQYRFDYPYDVPLCSRYGYNKTLNLHQFYIRHNDSSFSATSTTKPRTEMRIYHDFNTGKSRITGYFQTKCGSSGVNLLQVYGNNASIGDPTTLQLRAVNDTLFAYSVKWVYGAICDKFHYFNVTVDCDNKIVYVDIDSKRVTTWPVGGTDQKYFKIGAYTDDKASDEMTSYFRDVKVWQYSR